MEAMSIRKILDIKGSTSVFTIPASTTLNELVKCACEKNIGALLVASDSGELLGIVSERDIVRQYNDGVDFDKTTADDIMTKNLVCAKPGDDINIAMDLMVSKHIRHLPVVDEGSIEGLITVRDLIHAMRRADQDELKHLVEYLQSSLDDAQVSG